MDTPESIINDLKKRMDGAVQSLKHSLNGLRTGRASATILDPIKVEIYGSMMPLNQLATVSIPEPRLITVQVWDRDAVRSVEKAITNSGLGLNPMAEGQLIRIMVPDLSEERRRELTKKASEYCEQAKVSVRNVRRDGMDAIKKLEKDKLISEDDLRSYSDDIQTITDEHTNKMDELTKTKSAEILQL